MPLACSFKCYVSENGRDEIRDAYDGSGKQTQARFLSRLRMLSHLPIDEWNEPMYRSLHRECHGLGEIRFLADKIQQRPLGFRSGSAEFTILYWAHEKGWKFVPLSACQKALERKEKVLKFKDRCHALWLALE